jgi:glycosyltransferase involved in cell wall biosynthesis
MRRQRRIVDRRLRLVTALPKEQDSRDRVAVPPATGSTGDRSLMCPRIPSFSFPHHMAARRLVVDAPAEAALRSNGRTVENGLPGRDAAFSRGRRFPVPDAATSPPSPDRPARRPRVALVLLDAGSRSGTGNAAHELVRRGRADFDFTVVSTRLVEELRPLVEWRRVPAPSRPFRLRWLAFYLLAGLRLRGLRTDLVHTLAPAPLVPNRIDLATVLFSQAAFFESAAKPRDLRERLARSFSVGLEHFAYRPGRVRLLSALAPGGRRELERLHPGVPVVVTPHVLDRDRFHPDDRSREATRRELGAGGDDVVACFVNNDFWAHKGLAIAIRGFAEARRGAPDLAWLWVVGVGPVEGYRAIAREHGVAERVRFLGWRDDIESVYRGADVLVHPAAYETFSLAVHEAAACGLPVVATRVNGVEDLLADGAAGVLVERSERAVASALLRLARDPELRTRMGEAGRRRAIAFGPEVFTASVLAAYRDLLSQPRASPG